MRNGAGYDVRRPCLERSAEPHKGLPVRFYTYRGHQPWQPKGNR